MKNILLIVSLVIMGFLSSCKKAGRECECTYSDGTKLTIIYEDKSPKKAAKKYCEKGYNVLDEEGNADNTKDPDATCELK